MEELRQLNSGKTEVPAIDWDHYKTVIKTPGVVEEFQSAFAASSISPMENTFSGEVASSKGEMTAAAGKLVAGVGRGRRGGVCLCGGDERLSELVDSLIRPASVPVAWR